MTQCEREEIGLLVIACIIGIIMFSAFSKLIIQSMNVNSIYREINTVIL